MGAKAERGTVCVRTGNETRRFRHSIKVLGGGGGGDNQQRARDAAAYTDTVTIICSTQKWLILVQLVFTES
jgi:hypothetical protein